MPGTTNRRLANPEASWKTGRLTLSRHSTRSYTVEAYGPRWWRVLWLFIAPRAVYVLATCLVVGLAVVLYVSL